MKEHLIGKKIVDVREMTEDEADECWGWDTPGQVIVLDDGTELIPSRDPEGNDAGHLFIINKDGDQIQ